MTLTILSSSRKQKGRVLYQEHVPLGLEAVKRIAEEQILIHFGLSIHVAKDIEANGASQDNKTDVFLATALYSVYTDTIRLVPQNYCLVAWHGEAPVFDLDAAVDEPVRQLCQEAYRQYGKLQNQLPDQIARKCWLTWYISEQLKSMGYTPTVARSLVTSPLHPGR